MPIGEAPRQTKNLIITNKPVHPALRHPYAGEWITGVVMIVMLALLLITMICQAQPTVAADTGLEIGDQVPDITINHLINYPVTSIKISDFRDKLLILDFWASWCSSCLDEFGRQPALVKKFSQHLVILLVNNENAAKVKAAYLTNLILKTFKPVSVISDTVLGSYVGCQYQMIEDWVNDDQEDEEDRQQQLDELYTMHNAGLKLHEQISKAHYLEEFAHVVANFHPMDN